MGKRSKKKTAGLGLVFGIMGALVGWSFYNVLNQGVADILAYFGVVDFYIQNGIIILIFGGVLFIFAKKVLFNTFR